MGLQIATFLVFVLNISLSWCAPQASSRTIFIESTKAIPGPEKNYTGFRIQKDSKLVAYYHEQTIAIVELGTGRQLLNCEELEVKTKADRAAALKMLRSYKVKNQAAISFKDILDVQKHCQELDTPPSMQLNNTSTDSTQGQSYSTAGISSVFQGIFPGTKWCGRGDLAATYFDMGLELRADKCCRTHDLCPVKVSAMKTQYNITNYSMVTRSHCACDKIFYECLKTAKSPLTDVIGTLYYNVGDPQCVDEISDESGPVKIFRPNMLRY